MERVKMAYVKHAFIVLVLLSLVSCDGGGNAGNAPATFSLAWSEYPSWSVFGVAHLEGLIDKEEGKLGTMEKKWNVDIVLKEADYDTCLQLYGSGTVDAVCITNMDVLNPALTRESVAVLPTSTSMGADACLVVGVDSVSQLRGVKVYGLEKSVSEYCFVRNLEELGEKESDHQFTNMDPGAAATAMQTQSGNVSAIVVWNPFVLQTLKTRSDAKVLFDSTKIPEEIIDMVVVAKSALDKPGGDAFASAVIDAFYEISRRIEDPSTRDKTLLSIAAKFADLSVEEMNTVVDQTRFYKDAAAGIGLFEGSKLPGTMEKVVGFCVEHTIVESAPTVVYGSGSGQLKFDPSYMKKVRDRK